MAKIFDVTKTGTNAVTIAASSYRCITVNMPHEGQLGRIVVKQVAAADGGGTAVAFKVDILNSSTPVTPDTNIANATALPANIDIYKVRAQGTATSGNTFSEYTPDVGGNGYLYRNVDGTHTIPVRKIYVLIQPTSASGATKWEFALTMYTEIGGQ